MKSIWQSQGSSKGFTLLELLLAVTITSLVLAVLYASFFKIIEAKEAAEEELDLYHEARLLLAKISEDISMALKPRERESTKVIFYGVNNEDRDSLQFATLSHLRVGRDIKESDQCEVGYYLKPVSDVREPSRLSAPPEAQHEGSTQTQSNEDRENQLYFLMRREDPTIDDLPEEGGLEYAVSDRVLALNLRYLLNEGEVVDDWDSRTARGRGLPNAVEITLVLRGTRGKDIKITTTALIPIRALNQELGGNGGG